MNSSGRGLWGRIAALTGALGVISTGVGASLSDPFRSGLDPDPTDPSMTIAEALTSIREQARIGVSLGLFGAFLMLWFVGFLRGHLQTYEGERGWLSSVAFAGGVVAVTLLLMSSGIGLAATEITNYGGDAVVAKVFLTLGWNYFYVVSPGLIALVGASSIIGLRFKALPRWLALLGLVIVFLPLIAGAGQGAFLGLIWILVASVVLAVIGYGKSVIESASPES